MKTKKDLIVEKINRLHDKAMEYCSIADEYKQRHPEDNDEIRSLLIRALYNESFAAWLTADKDIEPTRFVLFSSAISIAKELGYIDEAEELKEIALAEKDDKYKERFLKQIGE